MRWCFVLVLVACSGSTQQIAIGPPPPRITRGTFAGALCDGGGCKCRDLGAPGDGGVGVPGAGQKRFEVRLTSANELWASVHGNQLYKSAERPEVCFYLDLPPGQWPVELHADNPAGVSAQWTIRELGTQTKSWYDSFQFECGHPGVCSLDNLDAQWAKLKSFKRGVEDPCGSVKIKSLERDAGRPPDGLHPDKLIVRLVLDVYKRVPTQSHGDPACGTAPPPVAKDMTAEPPEDPAPAP